MALTLELPPIFRDLQILILYLILFIGMGFKPSFNRILLTLPPFLLVFVQSIYRTEFLYYGVEYPMGVAACCVVASYLDQIILASPDKESWHRIPVDGKEKKESENGKLNNAVPQTFLTRVWWAMRYSTTNRFTGWSQQVKNTPVGVPRGYPRWRFVVRKSLRASWLFLASDTIQSYTASTPHGSYRGMEQSKVPLGFSHLSLPHQFGLAWLHIILTYQLLDLYNTLYGLVCVISGLATPRECPSLFNDLKGMYTVRQSWSLVWHQMCRRSCTASPLWLTRDVLRLKKGGFASKYVQLFLGFFISGIIHAGGVMLAHKSLDDDFALECFMWQACAIFVEDHVVDLGKYMGLRNSWYWRVLGYVWVVAWFGFSTMKYTSKTIESGIWIHAKQVDVFGLGPAA